MSKREDLESGVWGLASRVPRKVGGVPMPVLNVYMMRVTLFFPLRPP